MTNWLPTVTRGEAFIARTFLQFLEQICCTKKIFDYNLIAGKFLQRRPVTIEQVARLNLLFHG